MPGSPRQDIMGKQFLFSEQKQGKATFKLNETDLTWSQIWLFPATLCGQMRGLELQLDLGVS